MIFISRRSTAIRPMYEARDQGRLAMNDHFNRIGALRELRSITGLDLKSAVELIDRVIAGEELEVKPLALYGILELARFIKVMDELGFTVIGNQDEKHPDNEYFVAVDDEPVEDDLRIEIERRILLLIRSQNEYNQSWGHPPCNIPNLVPLSDMEVLDYFAGLVAVNSIPIG